jgi:hypothetical protein
MATESFKSIEILLDASLTPPKESDIFKFQ